MFTRSRYEPFADERWSFKKLIFVATVVITLSACIGIIAGAFHQWRATHATTTFMQPFFNIKTVNRYTDPETGCQYISPSDTAPFTPRLDTDGRQVCTVPAAPASSVVPANP